MKQRFETISEHSTYIIVLDTQTNERTRVYLQEQYLDQEFVLTGYSIDETETTLTPELDEFLELELLRLNREREEGIREAKLQEGAYWRSLK